MKCRNCPYGIDDYTSRIEMYKTVYGEYPGEKRANESEQFVWCNKVGGKVYTYGHCSEWYEQDEENYKNHSKKERINKRERYLKHQNHLKYLERVACKYPPAVEYVENPKPYYKRWYRDKSSSYLKRQSNKAIRRYKGELHNGYQQIHKVFDFWWGYY